MLSEAIDSAMLEAMLLRRDLPVHMEAHLRLVSQDGTGAWLNATPSRDSGKAISPELFRITAKRRLRLPVLDRPGICPCCGLALDVYMDHASVCQCNGDRTIRHNALRNLVCVIAELAGLQPEKEKTGLHSHDEI